MIEEYLDRKVVLKMVNLSDPTMRDYWRTGRFPRPLKNTERRLKFRRSEVEHWLALGGMEGWMREQADKQSAA